MPNIFDFSTLKQIKTVEVNPNGWVNPLTIEFGFSELEVTTCVWRIKGTKHTFFIPLMRLNYLSSGDYGKHFETVLETFKEEDYDSWRDLRFLLPWMREYETEYKDYIL
jgi:hypothetical protein